jgi:hypothetical protein
MGRNINHIGLSRSQDSSYLTSETIGGLTFRREKGGEKRGPPHIRGWKGGVLVFKEILPKYPQVLFRERILYAERAVPCS